MRWSALVLALAILLTVSPLQRGQIMAASDVFAAIDPRGDAAAAANASTGPGDDATVGLSSAASGFDALELVASDGSKAADGNAWGAHKNRIVRASDGTIYAVYTSPGQDDGAFKTWHLMRRFGPGDWGEVGVGMAGREPPNVLLGPHDELYVVAWPDGRPKAWISQNGGGAWTSEDVPGGWPVSTYPYAGAGISPNGTVYIVQSSIGPNGCGCDRPGFYNWAYRDPASGAWTYTATDLHDYRQTYAYVLPTNDGVTVVGSRAGHWWEFGWAQPPNIFPWVYQAVMLWQSPSVANVPLTSTTIHQVGQRGGEFVISYQADVYRDLAGNTHVLHKYVDATTSLSGRQVITRDGAIVKDATLPIWFPDQARMIQDTAGRFWVITLGYTGMMYAYPFDRQDGTARDGAYSELRVGGYAPASTVFLAAPRGGSRLEDVVDGVFAADGGAKLVYFRLRLRAS